MVITKTLKHIYDKTSFITSLYSPNNNALGFPKRMSHNEVERCLMAYWPGFLKLIKVAKLTDYTIEATFEVGHKREN